MSIKSILVIGMLVSSYAFADASIIVVYDPKGGDKGTETVALNEKGQIVSTRRTGTKVSSIKDLMSDEVYSQCWLGSNNEMWDLLKALVFAADADGDSYAELKSIRKYRNTTYIVKFVQTDEGGKRTRVYRVLKCG